MARQKLWLPFNVGSNNSAANTQQDVQIDTEYASVSSAEFKGTILAVKGYLTVAQDAPSNAMERFTFGMRVLPSGGESGDEDMWLIPSNVWFWRLDGYLNGPAGDATGLANLMAPFTFPIDGRSKRVVKFSDTIQFTWKTSGILKFGAAGRLLLLEA